MMFNYPYFGFPHYGKYSRYGYKYPEYQSHYVHTPIYQESIGNKHIQHNVKNEDCNCKHADNECVEKKEDSDNPLFEIFGIKLYFDDILIVCLIFFLYSESVKDQGLFIALVLLLLS